MLYLFLDRKQNKNNKKSMFKNKQVAIFLRPKTKNIKEVYKKIEQSFLKYDIKTVCDKESAKYLNENGLEFDKLCKSSDILVSIGGDGTLISLMRKSLKYKKPILGISAGSLGFLIDIQPDECDDFISQIINNNYRIDERSVLEVSYQDKNIIKTVYGVNDIVIAKSKIRSMLKVEAYTNEELIDSYYGDGLILSTPTGSTAYNLSSGGPILYPFLNAFIITPICSHALNKRSLVLPKEFELRCKVNEDAIIIVDGQKEIILKANDYIKVKIPSLKINMIHRLEKNYFKILNNKLNWGNINARE